MMWKLTSNGLSCVRCPTGSVTSNGISVLLWPVESLCLCLMNIIPYTSIEMSVTELQQLVLTVN